MESATAWDPGFHQRAAEVATSHRHNPYFATLVNGRTHHARDVLLEMERLDDARDKIVIKIIFVFVRSLVLWLLHWCRPIGFGILWRLVAPFLLCF